METGCIAVQQNGTSRDKSLMVKVYLKKTIGRGTFGCVKYCTAKVNNKPIGSFAVKIIKKYSETYSNYNREIFISKIVQHPNLMKVTKIVKHPQYNYMFMEYCKYLYMYMYIHNTYLYLRTNCVLINKMAKIMLLSI